MVNRSDIQIRDPFVLPVTEERNYYLFGTTDADPWRGRGTGFDVYVSKNLEQWNGPRPAFRPDPGFWADRNFWAPEVHVYRGGYYMFASFKSETVRRGTQILRADSPAGPYRVHAPKPLTPAEWECLDGTLYEDRDGMPWMVFCHEWVQVVDGEICALRLAENLREPEGEPITLFAASQAPWTRSLHRKGGGRVTDGPFLYRSSDDTLLLLWSSFSERGYAMGVARSESGEITGPWIQSESPIADNDSGHGMVFLDFDGRLRIAVHHPNKTPEERPIFFEVEERNGSLVRV